MKTITISIAIIFCLLCFSCSQKEEEKKSQADIEQTLLENKERLNDINDSILESSFFKKYPLLQEGGIEDFSFEYQKEPQERLFLLRYFDIIDVFINNSQLYIKIEDESMVYNLKLDTLKFPMQKIINSDLMVVKVKHSHTSNFKYSTLSKGENITIDIEHENTFFFDGEIVEYANYKRDDN